MCSKDRLGNVIPFSFTRQAKNPLYLTYQTSIQRSIDQYLKALL